MLSADAARRAAPIGVFDSGVGGLTVLAALERELPNESFLYLGDTARLPYGTKSAETVVRYALQATGLLVERGVKALVVACNTASAVALGALRERHADIPVIGVIEPGAQAACAASKSGRICVIATEGTVRGGAYPRSIAALRPDAHTTSIACQLFVALAEEGWGDTEVAAQAARRYLEPVFGAGGGADTPDTLVLGCTHFPVLRASIAAAAGQHVRIVDSAGTTARATRDELERLQLLTWSRQPIDSPPDGRLLVTDGIERFARIGARFLGREVRAQDVDLVDL